MIRPHFLLLVPLCTLWAGNTDAPSIAVSPAKATVRSGATQQFSASVQNLADARVTWSATTGTIDDEGVYTAPAPAPGDVTITAVSAADAKVSATVVIRVQNPTPAITSLSATNISPGEDFSIAINGRNFMSASVVALTGEVVTTRFVNSKQMIISGKSTAQTGTTMELTVVNPGPGGGQVSRMVTVLPAVSISTMKPATASVRLGATQQFTATVSGVTDKTVKWAVNGAAGGNATLGTIDDKGLYTAPAVMPAQPTLPAGVTLPTAASFPPGGAPVLAITATSVADAQQVTTAAVALINPVPAVTSVTPEKLTIGNVTLTVDGKNFVSGAQVQIGSKTLKTTFVSATRLTATGAVGAMPGQVAPVVVANPAPGAATSTALPVPVSVANPKVSYAAAYRFLEQASFGPRPADIAHIQEVGFEQWLNEQRAMAASPYDEPETSNQGVSSMQRRFFSNAFNGSDQLRQRMAFALSQIWVISAVKTNRAAAQVPYYEILLDDAFGNYRDLMEDATLSPAMGHFLDMVNNDKPDPTKDIEANENYARELLQLFTVGTDTLNADGSIRTDSLGNAVAAYTQQQITQLALVMTGWTYPTRPGSVLARHNPTYWNGPMEVYESNHDTSAKTVFGRLLPAGQTAEQDLSQALDMIFQHSNVGPFVAQRLIEHFVTSNPSPAYVSRVTAAFNNSGGVRGDLWAVLRTILLDPEARAGDTAAPTANGGHLREPVLQITGFLRALDATVTFTDNPLPSASSGMGQDVFDAPSVFNYYSPLFKLPGGLYGPEFQIMSQTQAVARANFVYSALTSRLGTPVLLNMQPWVQLAGTPNQLVETLNQALMHGTLSNAARTSIITALGATTDNTVRARNALYLVGSASQYQVQQ
jgi:uncharacterized protein (DUF1800 family)